MYRCLFVFSLIRLVCSLRVERALFQDYRSAQKQYGKDRSLVSIESVFAEAIGGLTAVIVYSGLREADKRAIGDDG
jgi:hypothetical protein